MAKAHLNEVSKGVVLNGKGERGRNAMLNKSSVRISKTGGVTTMESCGGKHQHYVEDDEIRGVDQYRDSYRSTKYGETKKKKKSGCGCGTFIFIGFILYFIISVFSSIVDMEDIFNDGLSSDEYDSELETFKNGLSIDWAWDLTDDGEYPTYDTEIETYGGVRIPEVSEEDVCVLVEIEQGVYILEVNEEYISALDAITGYTLDISGYEPEMTAMGGFIHTASDKYELTTLQSGRWLIEGSNWMSDDEADTILTTYKKLLVGMKERGF